MFKKWFDRDLPAARAYDAPGRAAAAQERAIPMSEQNAIGRSALDEIIAGLIGALKPGPVKQARQVFSRLSFKRTPGAY